MTGESKGLLSTFDGSDGEDLALDIRQNPKQGRRQAWYLLIGLLLISVVLNIIQFGVGLWEHSSSNRPTTSSIAGLTPNIPIDFGDKTEWGDASNLTALDELWLGMNLDLGVIQLPKSEHLGSTDDFPWDASKGLYVLSGHHNLHCLQAIYLYSRGLNGSSMPSTFEHVAHCLDILRSDIMCQADDTLLPFHFQQDVEREEKVPKRMCRNWNQLEDFAIKNSACLHRHEPDHPLYNTLAEYTNCPPGSPYHDLVEELKGEDAM